MEVSAGRITANRQLCMGSGLCPYVAPKYFDVVDGLVEVLQDQVSADDAESVAEAVEACPTRALAFAQSAVGG